MLGSNPRSYGVAESFKEKVEEVIEEAEEKIEEIIGVDKDKSEEIVPEQEETEEKAEETETEEMKDMVEAFDSIEAKADDEEQPTEEAKEEDSRMGSAATTAVASNGGSRNGRHTPEVWSRSNATSPADSSELREMKHEIEQDIMEMTVDAVETEGQDPMANTEAPEESDKNENEFNENETNENATGDDKLSISSDQRIIVEAA